MMSPVIVLAEPSVYGYFWHVDLADIIKSHFAQKLINMVPWYSNLTLTDAAYFVENATASI